MRGPNPVVTARARRLRRDATSAEATIWSLLRGRRLAGLKFTRQEPIGPYFVDFCCRERKLILEIDGATHSTGAELAYDAARTAFLEREGYRVLRVLNADVYESADGVAELILAALEGRA